MRTNLSYPAAGIAALGLMAARQGIFDTFLIFATITIGVVAVAAVLGAIG